MGLNNKGFAISGMLYASLILFLVLLFGVLSIMANRKIVLDKEKTEIINELNGVTDTGPFYTDYNEIKGVNAPKLATGMTPIKWSGTDWINTTENDSEWYDYSNKQWANAKTADGSFWVWIPRYAYQIASDYHTSTAGTINVKFLIDNTNLTIDETTIEDIPTYSGDSQTNYITHPAFTFGNTELTGMWVAKFEPSVSDQTDACYTSASEVNCNKTTLVPKIIPNASSWRYITVGNAFDVTLSMKNNVIYGWNSTEIDTHMMKNSEWGSVLYLAQSSYGKGDEIWINSADDFTTGCAGSTVDSLPTVGCVNEYNTTNGQKASTTGNVYGIYDISGGSWELMSSYIDNNDVNLATYGASIINADTKYKNIYPIGSSDTRVDNYGVSLSIFGDAIYETSSSYESSNTWYNDYSYMPYLSYAWLKRGSDINAYAGAYTFDGTFGTVDDSTSFRPVALVGDGL